MMRILVVALCALALPVYADSGAVHDCDREVAHPSDPDKVVEGVGSGEVVTHRAIPACRRAVAEFPDVARFHYQLGRAIVYWAGANDGNMDEGLEHLQHAADLKHEQAEFVLGLMKRTLGNVCASEPLTKRAADQGLKSARITYVNATLAGDYDDCGVSASGAEMQAYLEGAVSQVSGYYENMLLTDLTRRLALLDVAESEE